MTARGAARQAYAAVKRASLAVSPLEALTPARRLQARALQVQAVAPASPAQMAVRAQGAGLQSAAAPAPPLLS